MPTDVDVVVFDKDHAASEPRIVAEVGDFANQGLARLVGRMGLARVDDLDRPIGIGDQGVQPVEVLKHEVGPLVGGEPPSEADREDVRIEHRLRHLDCLVALTAAAALPRETAADELEQQVLEGVVRLPELARVALVDLLPDVGLAHAAEPVVREDAVVELQHLPRQPRGHVDAVGDVPDRHLLLDPPGPEVGPHLAADVAVEGANGIGPPRHLQAEHGHAEQLAGIVGLDAAQAHELVVGDAESVAGRPEVLLDQVVVEPVVAGWNGRVRREHRLPGHLADGVVEGIAVALHAAANGLERGEHRVAFVEVVDARHDSHRADRLHAADAQEDLLSDPRPRVAAVEAAGELTILGRVAFDVGVEQEEAHAADRHPPDLGKQRAAPRVDLHLHVLAIGVECGLDRQGLDPRLEILLMLVAIDVELLAKVALVVKQAHRDERDAQTTGALDVVTGEHAETSRVDRHRLVDPELGREVDDRLRAEHARVHVAPG